MFKEIPISQIHFTRRNPRSDPEEELEGLAASLGDEEAPCIAQFPLVEAIGEDEYRVIAGERRIRAAALRQWKKMPCMVTRPLDPLESHALRIAENSHRKNLHPLDEAAALKIAWLAANADALGLGDEVRAILDSDLPNIPIIDALQNLLSEHDFTPTAPAVPWEAVLDQLGISMHPEKRKKLMQVLTVDSGVQEQIKTLDITEAGLRAIARLEPEDQQRLVQEIADNPDLARKVRRISRVVHEGTKTLDDALAQARGELPAHLREEAPTEPANPDPDDPPSPEQPSKPTLIEDQRLAEVVVRCLDLATQTEAAFADLARIGDVTTFSPPWDEAAAEAFAALRTALKHVDK